MTIWRRVFLPFAAGYFFSYFLRNVNAVIAPELTRELGLSASDLGLLTSAYLFAFGLAQLPLGIALDRYGPRRVEAVLLLVAALGCAAFSLGSTSGELLLARGLIGLGVSSCLMASFKSFGLWFGSERQASLNAAVMSAGGLGAIAATTPLAWLVPMLGWRWTFGTLAVLGAGVALLIFRSPEKLVTESPVPLAGQVCGLRRVLTSRKFWIYAPQGSLLTGGFMAVQGLWAVPWLMNVEGLDRERAAEYLLYTSVGLLAGFLAIATLLDALSRRGLTPHHVLRYGMGLGLAATLCIVFSFGPGALLWFAQGLSFSAGNLAYALLQKEYPADLAGRVNTALNLMVFVGAFTVQWGFGAAVDALVAHAMPLREAFQISLLTLLGLQTISFLWFVAGIKARSDQRPDASASH